MQRLSTVLFKLLVFISIFSLPHVVQADSDLSKYVSASVGMVNVSFTESESVLTSGEVEDEGTENETPGSGSASIMSLEFSYHKPFSVNKEIFGRFIIPFQPSSGNALIYGGGGMNYFFNGQGTDVKSESSHIDLRVTPKFRYYVGGLLGLGYLVYVTESAKKSDILLDLGAQGGVIYAYKERWGIKGEFSISRGVGTKVSTNTMRMMLGTTYTF